MNDDVNRLAREMADAIAAAVASDPRIGACRAKARDEGYELQVSLEAVIGFSPRSATAPSSRKLRRRLEITAHDRRFLRSLRIAADPATEEVE
jgi:hypothetical protein